MELEKIITHIELEMTGETKRYLVSAKQGDKATRYIVATLLNNGVPYQIPVDSKGRVNVRKPDGKSVYNACTIEQSDVTIELTSQMLAAAGTAHCDVEIRTNDDTQIISSATFTMEIEPTQRDDAAIESSNEFTAFEKEIADAKQGLIDVTQKAEEALKTQEQLNETMGRAEDILKKVSDAQDGVMNASKAATSAALKAKDAEESAVEAAESANSSKTHTENLFQDIKMYAQDASNKVKDAAYSAISASESASASAQSALDAQSSAEVAAKSAEEAKQIAGGDFVPRDDVGKAGGIASLGDDGKVPREQLPELSDPVIVDDILDEHSINPVQNKVVTAAINETNNALGGIRFSATESGLVRASWDDKEGM